MISGYGTCKFSPSNSNIRRLPSLWMLVWLIFHHHLLDFCFSLNGEGVALLRFKDRLATDPFKKLSSWNHDGPDADPCSWYGVRCSGKVVVSLTLKDLCLGGTLAPELGDLHHVKSIILRNNSFYGSIPREISELDELEVLDLGYNNFTEPLPLEFSRILSSEKLLLDHNNFFGCKYKHNEFMLSGYQLDEMQLRRATDGACKDRLSCRTADQPVDFAPRRMLQVELPKKSEKRQNRTASASPLASPPASLASRRSPVVTKKKVNSSVSSPAPLHASPLSRSPSKSASEKKGNSSASSPVPLLASPPSRSPSKSDHSLRPPSLIPPTKPPIPSKKLKPPLSPSPAPSPLLPPSSSPSPSSSLSRYLPPVPTPSRNKSSPQSPPLVSLTAPVSSNYSAETSSASKSSHKVLIWTSVAGTSIFVIISGIGIFICRSSKVVTVRPWATGLSGQLQKAFVSGVPKLKRAELETACEDFSNIIGSLTDSVVYKGTLSTGVEIAVVSSLVKSCKQWSKNLEAQFRKKVETLSKVNHKNFVNLIGYCVEEKPFSRMMIFEYAPSGTLFEHLHIKEAERLDWKMRLRIIMGMAYCLEHMHQLNPPVPHRNLQSSCVYLTDDYAAKVSDFSFWNELTTSKIRSPSMQLLEASMSDTESNVHNFGLILFEVITGRIPYSGENGCVEDWVWEHLGVDKLPKEIIDPTLIAFDEEEVQKLIGVVKDCVHPDPKKRPEMREVALRLNVITGIKPDGATPRVSPLWWAELEILSSQGNMT